MVESAPGLRVLSREQITVAMEDDISVVRHAVRALSDRCGLDPFATAALTTAASELTRNAWVHAGGGVATLEQLQHGSRLGIGLQVSDSGPGIRELERALQGHYSTRRSLGLGLSGSRRLADEFQIDSAVGRGTTVRIVKWKRL